ncbi:ComEC/Rec2 family competence protein [Sphingomonas solaris]|uniref:ComEC/Rec2 family competence protein n=2 Tax=Alterirhizorhabdus solaris TaxID=2529389 RepID=A0A558R157_9SPHN|nr:ComEC/Rec2 family competence protein [Sphingomonas solaris]
MAPGRRQTTVAAASGRLVAGAERWLDAERDHLPLWLPVALGGGITAWFVLAGSAQWAGFILLMAALACACAMAPGGGRLPRTGVWLALLLALGCGIVWLRAEQVRAPRLARPQVARFEARVEAVEPQPARGMVRLRLAPDGAAGLPPRLRVNVDEDKMPAGLATGARVALRARLMPPAPAAVPGAYDFARVAWFQGLGATGRALDPVRIVDAGPRGHGFWEWLGGLRNRLSAHIRAAAPGPEGAIAAAFATGDQGAIPEDDAEAMRRSGLAHLLSVSGLHVTAVVGGVMLLALRLLALSPRLALRAPLLVIAAGAGALAGIAYTFIAGAEVPTVRSCVAALLVLGGIVIGREAMTLRLVATGALVVLLFRPESIAGPSFQLSFAAVTAIVALHEHPWTRGMFGPAEESRARRLARGLGSLLLTGLVVELALMPIAIFHFHRAGLYGAVANIVAIPLTTFVVMPLEALALVLDPIGLGAPAWWLTDRSLALLLAIAHHVADLPGAVTALPSMPHGAFALMALGGLWLALWRTRVRALGWLPIAIGLGWTLATPPPDLLVTGDGRHLAVRGNDGHLSLLRERAGDYVRDMLGETSGVIGEAGTIDALPGARCGADLCVFDVVRGGRRWRVLATRSPYLVDIAAMNLACAGADIVVSERRLPRTCRPRWLRIDRVLLAETGGLAIALAPGRIETVAATANGHPWSLFGPLPARPHRAWRGERRGPSVRRSDAAASSAASAVKDVPSRLSGGQEWLHAGDR